MARQLYHYYCQHHYSHHRYHDCHNINSNNDHIFMKNIWWWRIWQTFKNVYKIIIQNSSLWLALNVYANMLTVDCQLIELLLTVPTSVSLSSRGTLSKIVSYKPLLAFTFMCCVVSCVPYQGSAYFQRFYSFTPTST